MHSAEQVRNWHAIEALRAGVPSRDAVQALGATQTAVDERFRRQLLATQGEPPPPSSGLLIAGAFGTGKSHLLEYLHHLALEQHFVASKVVISKETPLYNPAKVYAAAVQSARGPDRVGTSLTEIARRINFNSPEYARFRQWVDRPDASLAATFFAATVLIHERSRGEVQADVIDALVQFWSGSPLPVGKLKTWLKDMRESSTYNLRRVTDAELTLERLRFTPQLIRAADYAGWVIFLDEVELIRQYTLFQRTRSYRAVAHWLGGLQGATYPGLTTVLAINSDFEAAVLDPNTQGSRKDEEIVPAHVYLTTYDSLRFDFTTNRASPPRRRVWDLVILDEAQRIKNRDTEIARKCKALPRRRAWALTGTPLENQLDDLASLLEFLAPWQEGEPPLRVFPESDLLARHRTLQLRRKKADVLPQLPLKTVIHVTLPLTASQRETYRAAEEQGILDLRGLGANAGVQHVLDLVVRLKQICNVCPRTGQSSKLDDLRERLRVLRAEGHRALVFSQFTERPFGVDEVGPGWPSSAPCAIPAHSRPASARPSSRPSRPIRSARC